MKKSIIAILVLSLLVSYSSLAGMAIEKNLEKGQISVNVSADTEVAPDVVEISFAIKTSDTKSLQKATDENKLISDRVYKFLKEKINTEQGDFIKTSDYTANPIYSYQNSKKIFQKYEVSNRVIVRTKLINDIGQIIDQTIASGATNVDSLHFSLSNYDTQCNNLLKTTTQKAKRRADVVANALSQEISGIKSITTSCNVNGNNSPRLYMAKNMIADTVAESSGITTSISNGVVKINANVNAIFFVE